MSTHINKFTFHIPQQVIVVGIFPVGSRNDPEGKEGLAHFAEHISLQLTHPEYSGETYKTFLESRGIDLNATTYKDKMYFYQISLPEQAQDSLRLLQQHLKEGSINSISFEKEKKVVQQELREREGELSYQIYNTDMKLLFPQTHLSKPVLGSTESISAITQSDVQNFFKKYMHFDAGYLFLIDTGNPISTQLIEGGAYTEMMHEQMPVEDTHQKVFIDNKQSKTQSMVSISFRTDSLYASTERQVARIVQHYLANNWSSILVKELREKRGVLYWIDTFSDYFADTGYVSINYSTESVHLDTTLETIFSEIEKIIRGEIDQNILASAKKIYQTSLSYIGKAPQNIISWATESQLYNTTFESPELALKASTKVSAEDLQQYATKYLSQNKAKIIVARAK